MSLQTQTDTVISVRDLSVNFTLDGALLPAVNGISFDVRRQEIVGIVGESGSGKSLTAAALLRMTPEFGEIRGTVHFMDRNVLTMTDSEIREVRGAGIALVPQNPLAALNPVVRVGVQLEEAMLAHGKFDRPHARARAQDLLNLVGIPDAADRLQDFPHQFSGGMRQRLLIAMAVSNEPKVIVADEPTTALDVTIQAQIVDLLIRINKELGTAIVLITHNLGVAAKLCDRLIVMYAGQVVEEGPTKQLLSEPEHPYTRALLNAVPRLNGSLGDLQSIPGKPPSVLARNQPGCPFASRCERATDRCSVERPILEPSGESSRVACWHPGGDRPSVKTLSEQPSPTLRASPSALLSFEKVTKRFGGRNLLFGRNGGQVTAVNEVSLSVSAGETLGLVGESGSGKSTLARLALSLDRPSEGQVLYRGSDITQGKRAVIAEFRRKVQIVFQDPKSSLNPWLDVEQSVSEPLRVQQRLSAGQRRIRSIEALEQVGLGESDLPRHVSEFSGGQQQRIALARALIVRPELVVCDEPVSALDVSVQAQIVNLLIDLQRSHGLSYLFVAHDLAVVQNMSHRIAVMYLGRIVEVGPATDVSTHPQHPYTASLYSAVPVPDVDVERNRPRIVLSGDMPSPRMQPPGCPFQDRCPIGPKARSDRDICVTSRPALVEHGPGQSAACHFPGELKIAGTAGIGTRDLLQTNG